MKDSPRLKLYGSRQMENQVAQGLPEGRYLRPHDRKSDEVPANVTQLMLELQQEVDQLFATVKAQEDASQELEEHLIELNDKLVLASKSKLKTKSVHKTSS